MKELCISDHAGHHSRNASSRASGTCEWILRHQSYRRWLSLPQKASFLWLSGYPGCGKSTLASFLIDELRRGGDGDGEFPGTPVCCYFFFKDDDDQRRSADRAMCTILHQLFTANPQLIRHALAQSQKGERFSENFPALWNILLDASNDPQCGDVLCILDGMDECEEASQVELIESIEKWYTIAAGPRSLKFVVTSRPSRTIEKHFFSFPKIRLKAEVEATRKDIAALVRSRIGEDVAKFRGLDDSARTEIEDKLVRNAQGNFLYVDLVLRLIEDTCARDSAEALRTVLDKPPMNLDAVYEKILSLSPNASDTWRLLHIILAAKSPLTLEELNTAFVIKPSNRIADIRLLPDISQMIRQLCSHFVRIIDSRVYLVHQTAKDFLCHPVATISPAQTQSQWKHSFHPVESHRILTLVCVSLLELEARGEQEKLPYPFPLLDYARRYWSWHAQFANLEDDSQILASITRLGPSSKSWPNTTNTTTTTTKLSERTAILALPVEDKEVLLALEHEKRYQQWYLASLDFGGGGEAA